MKKIFFISIISSFLFISCDIEVLNSENIQISCGYVCGWCGGYDSLFISEDDINYEFISPCYPQNNYSENDVTDKEEWIELLSILDFNEFKKIEINTCNVCVDGCDNWISILKGSEIHKITYGYEDSLIVQKIAPFIDKLQEIRLNYIRFEN